MKEMVPPETSATMAVSSPASQQNGISSIKDESPSNEDSSNRIQEPEASVSTPNITDNGDTIQDHQTLLTKVENDSVSKKDSLASKGLPNSISDKNWPFEGEQMYKIAFKFFKDNDGKAFHCSYDQRNLMIAYSIQIKSGDYNADKERPLGAFDFVGQDIRNAWITLQGMSKSDAESKFVNTLDTLCKTFRYYVMAIKCDQDEKERKLKEEAQRKKKEEEEALEAERKAQEAEKAAQEEKKRKYEEQKQIIKQLLNQQTFHQFSSYAKKQYPNDLELQNNLIKQLQDQHFQQYMLQMLEQSADLNNIIAMNLTNNNNNMINGNSSGDNNNMNYNNNNNNNDSSEVNTRSSTVPAGTSSTKKGHDVMINLTEESDKHYISPSASSSNDPNNDTNIEECQIRHVRRTAQGSEDDNYSEETEEYIEDVINSIEPASMWTRKDIGPFKDAIKSEGGEGILTIGHGEMATIRVPTHENGNCIFWEFATDYYDVGFGLFFEWNSSPDKQLSIHISESEGEDDEDEIDPPATDPESGNKFNEDGEPLSEMNRMLNEDSDSPITVIIPIYRRESHNEVFAGSHNYPGKGVYLLKFDNSFSLWRSKTIYYRVYYTKEN